MISEIFFPIKDKVFCKSKATERLSFILLLFFHASNYF